MYVHIEGGLNFLKILFILKLIMAYIYSAQVEKFKKYTSWGPKVQLKTITMQSRTLGSQSFYFLNFVTCNCDDFIFKNLHVPKVFNVEKANKIIIMMSTNQSLIYRNICDVIAEPFVSKSLSIFDDNKQKRLP